MDKAEFERAFSLLYFALAAHTAGDGLLIHGGEAHAEEGTGIIHLADDAELHLSQAQVMAYLEADVLEQQTILSELAREVHAAIERSRAEAPAAE